MPTMCSYTKVMRAITIMLEINVTFNKYSGKETLNLRNRHIFYISQTFPKSELNRHIKHSSAGGESGRIFGLWVI